MGALFQNFDCLHTGLRADDRSNHHDCGKFQVDIAENTMGACGHDRFPYNVSKVGPHDIIHWQSHGEQCRSS